MTQRLTQRRRVLVVRVGAMGDVLHALPAVTALRHAWPEAVIDWVVDPRWAPLLVDEAGRGPVVSGVHVAETRLWSQAPFSAGTVRSVAGLWRGLRAGAYRYAVDVQGTLRSAVIGRMAGSGNLVGFADPREAAAVLFYDRRVNRCGMHVVGQNAALLGEALGLWLVPVPPELPRREEAEAWAERRLAGMSAGSGVALLAPAAGWGAKQWPADRFAALAGVLRAMGLQVLVNAGVADEVAAEVVRVSEGAAEAIHCDVAQLVALTRRAAVVVGGDTGPVHLAAALGRPVVALFGPTDPTRNGPWGDGPERVLRDARSVTTYKRSAVTEAGLRRIEVERVVAAVEEVLGSGSVQS